MRNPDRLDNLYQVLHDIHKKAFPDWRFGQFMSNFLGWVISENKCQDIFFPEDNKWIQWIKEYGKEN